MTTEPPSSPSPQSEQPREQPSEQPSIVSTDPADNNAMHPDVNANPGFWQLLLLGFQHVLACYAGAVAVPLFVGYALVQAGKMDPSYIPHLITADLLVAGIATIVQSIGVWRFGVRLPLIQGCTFSAAIPMVTIGSQSAWPQSTVQ